MGKQETLGHREVNSSRAMLFHWKLYLLSKKTLSVQFDCQSGDYSAATARTKTIKRTK